MTFRIVGRITSGFRSGRGGSRNYRRSFDGRVCGVTISEGCRCGGAEGGIVARARSAAVVAGAADTVDRQVDDVAGLAVVADVEAGVEAAVAIGGDAAANTARLSPHHLAVVAGGGGEGVSKDVEIKASFIEKLQTEECV